MTAAGRLGFVTRGVVYVVVGVLALRIAFGSGGPQPDRQGALQQVAAEPGGPVLLWAIAVGFGAMALWRGAAAFLGRGDDAKAGQRVLNAGRSLVYVSACWGTVLFASHQGGGGQSSSDRTSQDWTARALAVPGGRVVAGAVAVAVVGIGVGAVVSAVRHRFRRKLETGRMGRRTRAVVDGLGTAGTAARGVVLAAAGVFLFQAVVRFDPHQAKGLDQTLRSLARTPVGPWLLVLVAAGLVSFGLFSFACARWRRM